MTQSSENSQNRNTTLTPFVPPVGLKNAHLQTVFSSQGPRKLNRDKRFKPYLSSQRPMMLNGGDGVRLEGYYNRATDAHSKHDESDELVIMIHGWEGSHESTYMKSMAATLLQNGFDTFRLNMRDHGDTHHLNRGVFNSTLLDEVISAIEDLQSRTNYQRYTLVGFSLGGNFSLRVASNAKGRNVSLTQVIAFCPVVHAAQSNLALNEKRNVFYGKYFVRKWRRSLRKKLEYWPEYQYSEQLEALNTLDELNQEFIPKYTEFSSLEDYFDAYAIDGNKLSSAICPCHLHFAKDDMIIPVGGVASIEEQPNVHVTVSDHGGHCGFIMNWRGDSWQDLRALELIRNSRADTQ